MATWTIDNNGNNNLWHLFLYAKNCTKHFTFNPHYKLIRWVIFIILIILPIREHWGFKERSDGAGIWTQLSLEPSLTCLIVTSLLIIFECCWRSLLRTICWANPFPKGLFMDCGLSLSRSFKYNHVDWEKGHYIQHLWLNSEPLICCHGQHSCQNIRHQKEEYEK